MEQEKLTINEKQQQVRNQFDARWRSLGMSEVQRMILSRFIEGEMEDAIFMGKEGFDELIKEKQFIISNYILDRDLNASTPKKENIGELTPNQIERLNVLTCECGTTADLAIELGSFLVRYSRLLVSIAEDGKEVELIGDWDADPYLVGELFKIFADR